MTPFVLSIVSPTIGVILASLVGCSVYLYKKRTMASVELVVNREVPPISVHVAVTNHGRSPIVITGLRLHVPAKCLGVPGVLSDRLGDVSIWRRNCLLGLRRKLETSGSRNDAIASGIKKALPEGFGVFDVVGSRETITIGPYEKVSKRTPLEDCWGTSWYELPLFGTLSNPIVLVPSCKIANHRPLIWWPPKIVGRAPADTASPFWEISMAWN